MITQQKQAFFIALAFMATLGLISPTQQIFAASVTSPATASISSDSVIGDPVALPALTITETAPADIPTGTLTWTAPTGFIFDTSSLANVTYVGTGLSGSINVTFPNNTHMTLAITATSSVAGSLTIGNSIPVKIKAQAGQPLAASGNILLSSGNIIGLTSTSTFGILTQIPGAANKLMFNIQPPINTTVNTAFNVSVAIQDQFNNTVTSDNGRAVTLTTVQAANSNLGTNSTLNGTTTVNNTAGIAIFNNLSYPLSEHIKLKASTSGLTEAISNAIFVLTTPTSTTTPSISIHNGKLVKVAGSPTIYMVVNNILRPFVTPALFHSKGKKFQDVIIITPQQFATFAIGLPIGQGKDDDRDGDDDEDITIIMNPPLASSTLTSLSSLPDGTLVKIPGNPTIYIVSGGIVKPFTSLQVFKAHKKSFNQIREISPEELSAMAIGSPVSFPDGTLLKGSDATIYVVKNGLLYGIPNMQILKKHNLSLNNLLKVKDNELNEHDKGGIED